MKLRLLYFLLLIGSNINSDELSFYQNFKSEYCVANPYNCKSDGSVVSYSVNDFLKTLYREVDNTFHVYGYTAVQFEYCESHRKNNCYRVIDDEDYDLKYRRTNDNYVKKGPYKITKQYPGKDSWFSANGGVNRDLGIYFYKTLKQNDLNTYCTSKYKTGRALKENISAERTIEFVNIYKNYEKNNKVLYRVFLPNLIDFGPRKVQDLDSECLIIDRRVFIPTILKNEVSFRLRNNATIFYGK